MDWGMNTWLRNGWQVKSLKGGDGWTDELIDGLIVGGWIDGWMGGMDEWEVWMEGMIGRNAGNY